MSIIIEAPALALKLIVPRVLIGKGEIVIIFVEEHCKQIEAGQLFVKINCKKILQFRLYLLAHTSRHGFHCKNLPKKKVDMQVVQLVCIRLLHCIHLFNLQFGHYCKNTIGNVDSKPTVQLI